MIDKLKAGDSIRCTILKAPHVRDRQQTIERLMRNDASVRRGLRKAHRKRQQNMIVYNRGFRDWVSRRACGKIVRVAAGQTWTMVYSPGMAHDFNAVAAYLKVEKA